MTSPSTAIFENAGGAGWVNLDEQTRVNSDERRSRTALCDLLGVEESRLARVHRGWIESKLRQGNLEREPLWSEAVAVGRRSFVERVQEDLGSRARYRQIEDLDGVSVLLRDAPGAYTFNSNGEMRGLTPIRGSQGARG